MLGTRGMRVCQKFKALLRWNGFVAELKKMVLITIFLDYF
jgi:hypothetical protein